MASVATSSLAILYDAIFYAKGDAKFNAWKSWALDPLVIRNFESFVSQIVSDRSVARHVGTAEGSYNMMLRFHFTMGADIALRIPKPGHTASAVVAEKVENEVAWMQFLAANTQIPIPRVYSYGTNGGSDMPVLNVPYMLMDFIDGDNLRDFLNNLLGQETAHNAMRSSIFKQIADFYLQLHDISFESIGSITEDQICGGWRVTKRPLTMDMHQLLIGIPDYKTDDWTNKPFQCSDDYLDFLVTQQRNQLWNLRNLNVPRELVDGASVQRNYGQGTNFKEAADLARHRHRARRGFEKLIPHFQAKNIDDTSRFVPFNPDFDTRKMLVDPRTGQITGVIDFDFTNTMLVQFSRDPPLFLYRVLPGQCLQNNFFPWFLAVYEPILHQFLEAMKELESKRADYKKEKQLSSWMLESWTSQRCWFNFAANHIDHIDSIYWEVLHKVLPEGNMVPKTLSEVESEGRYVEHTSKQIREYESGYEEPQ